MGLVLWPPADGSGSAEALVARSFGSGLGDMVVEFDRSLNAAVSAVLQACLSSGEGASFGGAEISDWTIVKRRQGVIAVAVATHGRRRKLMAACQAEDCGAMLDLDLDLVGFRQDWRIESVPFAAGRLRLPRPSDLAQLGDPGEGADRLAHLLLDGEAPDRPGWEAEAEAALSEADQLADLELNASCPDCGHPVVLALLLEEQLIGELSRETARLMDEVHLLAMTYHWSEPDIVALPEIRRRHYLDRIREGWAA